MLAFMLKNSTKHCPTNVYKNSWKKINSTACLFAVLFLPSVLALPCILSAAAAVVGGGGGASSIQCGYNCILAKARNCSADSFLKKSSHTPWVREKFVDHRAQNLTNWVITFSFFASNEQCQGKKAKSLGQHVQACTTPVPGISWVLNLADTAWNSECNKPNNWHKCHAHLAALTQTNTIILCRSKCSVRGLFERTVSLHAMLLQRTLTNYFLLPIPIRSNLRRNYYYYSHQR